MTLRFTKLTRDAIRALVPGKHVSENGICAKKLKNGDTLFSVDILCDGHRIHRTIGRASEGVTRSQAETFIEMARTEARAGRLNMPVGRKFAHSFKDASTKYVAKLKESGGKNIARKESQLERCLVPHFGSMRIDKITAFAVASYSKSRRDSKASCATINRELATLSHLLRCAARWEWIKKDAVPEIEKLPEGQGRIRVLSAEECRSLMQAALSDHDPDLPIFVGMGLCTSMRHVEILKAKWTDFDFPRRRLFLPQAKSGSREQPLPIDLVAMLENERKQADDPNGWVFPSRKANSKLGHRGYVTKSFRRIVIAAGLDPTDVTPHVMRHTAVTRLVRAGVDLPTIMSISGHKTLAMVLRYTHVDAAHIDIATAALTMPAMDQSHPEVTTSEFHSNSTEC